jgi:hypothetical protein
MSKGTLAIGYGSVAGFLAAAVVAAISISAVGAVNTTPLTMSVDPGTASVEFDSLPADTYTFTATPVDAQGNPLTAPGYSPPSTSLVVPADTTVTLSVPNTLAATLG